MSPIGAFMKTRRATHDLPQRSRAEIQLGDFIYRTFCINSPPVGPENKFVLTRTYFAALDIQTEICNVRGPRNYSGIYNGKES